MKPIPMEHNNVTLGREDCDDLPATYFKTENYGMAFATYWEPSEEDRARIAAGGHVRLIVHGGAHPPVWLDTEA